jgi:hypothetical protein
MGFKELDRSLLRADLDFQKIHSLTQTLTHTQRAHTAVATINGQNTVATKKKRKTKKKREQKALRVQTICSRVRGNAPVLNCLTKPPTLLNAQGQLQILEHQCVNHLEQCNTCANLHVLLPPKLHGMQ